MANKLVRIATPEPGVLAIHHSGNMDGRFVHEVSEDGTEIRLSILGQSTEWLPAAHYNFYKENR